MGQPNLVPLVELTCTETVGQTIEQIADRQPSWERCVMLPASCSSKIELRRGHYESHGRARMKLLRYVARCFALDLIMPLVRGSRFLVDHGMSIRDLNGRPLSSVFRLHHIRKSK